MATSPEPGLLRIEELDESRHCEIEKSYPTPDTSEGREEPENTEGDYDWSVPDELLPVTRKMIPRAAVQVTGDVAAYGSLEAGAANMSARVTRQLGTRMGMSLLRLAGFASPQIAIATIGIVACAELIYHFWLDEEAGSVKGEPHFVTNDGLSCDLQSVGEFVVARSEKYGFEVQGRLSPIRASHDVSVMFQAATEVADSVVEFDERDLFIDGEQVEIPDGELLYLGHDSYIMRSEGQYLVVWDGIGGPVMSWRRGFARVWIPPAPDNDMEGLLGNSDGNPDNDLRLADGTQLPPDTSPEVLHADFADSWRITNDQSFFTYDEGESTETFSDLEFPSSITTVHDLTAEQSLAAGEQCADAGMPPGPEFNACVLDIALTADETFADATAVRRSMALDPLAQPVDEFGDLSVDFESETMPSNLVPSRVSVDDATTSFAGPFTGFDTYRFYVQELPLHTTGTLTFDVVAVGDWAADSDTETVEVELDRDNLVSIDPTSGTLVDSGTFADGTPFTTWRVTVPFDHTSNDLEVSVSATGVSGIFEQAFGVDNIMLDLNTVPPETFEVSVPTTISEETGAGAGNLETEVSHDVYEFELTEPQSLYVDPVRCVGDASMRLTWRLMGSDDQEIASGALCNGARIGDLAAGAYELVVNERSGHVGSYTVAIASFDGNVTDTLTIGGPASTVTTNAPGQQVAWSFEGTAGQRVAIDLHGGTLDYSWDASATLRAPDGTEVATTSTCGKSCLLQVPSLPADGGYVVEWDPRNERVGSMTAQAFEIADTTGDLIVDGDVVDIVTSAPGQNARLSFDGTTGQRIGVEFTDGTLTYNHDARLWMRGPDGAVIADEHCGHDCFLHTSSLPADGEYTLEWDPREAETGSISAQASVVADVTGGLAVDGAPVELTTTVPGQNAIWTFDASADQRVLVDLTDVDLGLAGRAAATLVTPDGSELSADSTCGGGCVLGPTSLDAAGTYHIVLDPEDADIGAATARLYEVLPDTEAEVAIGNDPITVETTTPGQRAIGTFDGQADQQVQITASDGTLPGASATVSVLGPDGSELSEDTACGRECAIGPLALPQSGSYRVVYDPEGASVGSLTVQLHEVIPDVTAPITIDGDPVTLETTVPGQNGAWTFDATGGERISVELSDGTLGTYSAAARLISPDGTEIAISTWCGADCLFGPIVLEASGTYRIVFDPNDSEVGALTARVHDAGTDPTAELAIDGDPVTLETTVPGQNAAWTFDATAGQSLIVELSNGTLGTYDVEAILLAPDGTELVDSYSCGAGCVLEPTPLSESGTYQVVFDPQDAYVGSATARVVEAVPDPADNIVIDGEPVTLETTVAGQNAIWTFEASAGQNVFIQMFDGTLGTYDASVILIGPEGTELDDDFACGTACVFGPTQLPGSGEYQIVYDPDDANVGALTAQVYEVIPDTTATLDIDGDPVTLETTVPGQNAVWTFDATAGQEVQIALSDGTLGAWDAAAAMLAPDGSSIDSDSSCGSECEFGPTVIDQTGTHQVVFDPDDAHIGALTAHATLVTSEQTVDASPYSPIRSWLLEQVR